MPNVGVLGDVEVAKDSPRCHNGTVHGGDAEAFEVTGLEVLEQRLRGRGTDPEDAIRERLDKAAWELDFAKDKVDVALVNDRLEETFSRAETLIDDFLCK